MSKKIRYFTPRYDHQKNQWFFETPTGASTGYHALHTCQTESVLSSEDCAARGWILKDHAPEIHTMTVRRRCIHCEDVFEVEFESSFQDVEEKFEEQLEADGWVDGISPDCIAEHGQEIAAQQEADADYTGEDDP